MKYYTDEQWVKRLGEEGSYPEGTTFKRNSERKGFWDVTCPKCSNDEYVQAGVCSGVFTSSGANILKGRLACRCSAHYYWTEAQREYQIKKICKEEDFEFLGWVGEFNGNKTVFKWICADGHLCETCVNEFINSCVRCRKCKIKERGDNRRHVWVGKERFTKEGHKQVVIKEDDNRYLYYICEHCNRDMELFPTLFKIDRSSWSSGGNSCGCGEQVRWKQHQYYTLCERACKDTGKPFIGFYGEWKGKKTKVVRHCCIHGLWNTSLIDKIITKEQRDCPECAKCGFKRDKPAYIYLVKWYDDNTTLIKFGITNLKVSRRVSNQRSKTDLNSEILFTYYHKDGGFIADLEWEIKQKFKQHLIVPKHILPDGYTEAFFYDKNVLEDVKTYIENKLSNAS